MAVLKRTISAQGGVQTVFHDLGTSEVVVQVRSSDGEVHLATIKVDENIPNSIDIGLGEQFVGQTFDILIAY